MAVYQVGYQVKEKYPADGGIYTADFGGGGHQADVGPGTDPGFGRRSAGCSTTSRSQWDIISMNRDQGAGQREKLQQLGQQDGGLPLLSRIKGFETVHRF